MRREVWIICLLLSIGSTTTEDASGEEPAVDSHKNSSSSEDANDTVSDVTTTSEGINSTETVTGEAGTTKTQNATDEEPPADINLNTTSTGDDIYEGDGANYTQNTARTTTEGANDETSSNEDQAAATEPASTKASNSESVAPEGPTTESASTARNASNTDAASTKPEDTTSRTITVPTTPASPTTSPTTAPTTEGVTIASTKRTRSPTKRTTAPQPGVNEDYGIYIDSHRCEHRVLETGGRFYTTTCRAKCGKRYHNARDWSPCLYKLRRSPRFNRGGPKCTMGFCKRGECSSPYIGEVSCQAPKGTIHYYDYDDNSDPGQYDDEFYNSYEDYQGNPNYEGYPDTYNYPGSNDDDYNNYYRHGENYE